MSKRVSRNSITVIAGSYNDILHSGDVSGDDTVVLFDIMVSALADMLEGDNDNFDRDRFYDAVYAYKKGDK